MIIPEDACRRIFPKQFDLLSQSRHHAAARDVDRSNRHAETFGHAPGLLAVDGGAPEGSPCFRRKFTFDPLRSPLEQTPPILEIEQVGRGWVKFRLSLEQLHHACSPGSQLLL